MTIERIRERIQQETVKTGEAKHLLDVINEFNPSRIVQLDASMDIVNDRLRRSNNRTEAVLHARTTEFYNAIKEKLGIKPS